MSERLEAKVSGIVQGVGYRWFVVDQATRLDVTGWVANEPDGAVRVVAEGSGAALDALLAALRRGPLGASVESVDANRLPATGEFSGFGVRAGAHRGD
jgi:acylphosphatase